MITNLETIPSRLQGIYKINYSNGKVYIGQAQDIRKRGFEHNSRARNVSTSSKKIFPCDLALCKYDAELEILEKNILLTKLDDRETYWINFYNSTNKNIGYNILTSGDASFRRGVNNLNALFSQQELDEIINLLINNRELSYVDIGKRYNCSPKLIGDIARGQTYIQEELQYPLRFQDHQSQRKNQVLNYFTSEEELLNLKDDLKFRWDLGIETDLVIKYSIPLKILRGINQGKIFQEYGNYNYPIRLKNVRNNANLTIEDVQQILQLLRNSFQSMKDIGLIYHLDRNTISRINLGQAYIIKDYDYPARKKAI